MKHYVVLLGALLLVSNPLFAAENAAPEAAPVAEAPAAVADAAAFGATPPAPDAAAAEAPLAGDAAAVVAENLEFISGEVSVIDEAAKSVTVKLYGEAETEATNKVLTVTADDATDITDGEKDRELKSLTAGTEVDVEYDPASNKATYIFVY